MKRTRFTYPQLLAICLSLGSLPVSLLNASDYQSLQSEVRNEMQQAYNDCIENEAQEQYQMALAECQSQGLGSNISGGCETLAATKSLEYEEMVDYDCNSLKPSAEQIQLRVDEEAIHHGLQKPLPRNPQ
jgi:hypothetical protein